MIRPVAIALVLFCIPFALYAVYLWGTRSGVLDALVLAAADCRLADDRGALSGDRRRVSHG